MASAFETCIREQMQRKRFGEAKANAIVRRFNGLSEQYRQAGAADPELQAMTQAFDEFHAKAAMVAGTKLADLTKLLDNRAAIKATPVKNGQALAVRAMMSQDPRFGRSYDVRAERVRGQIWRAGGDVMEHIQVGALGVQRGKAYENNIAREITGKNTGDMVARDVATGVTKMFDLAVDLLNSAAGGEVVRKIARYLPQKMIPERLIGAGFKQWSQDMMGWLDWVKMFHPDGAPIKESEKAAVLRDVFDTITLGGKNKDDAGPMGVGTSVRSRFDQHRFLVFRNDNDAWLQMHKAYGDKGAGVYQVIAGHIEDLTHEIALTQQFGNNPRMMYNSLKHFAAKEAAAKTKQDIAAGKVGIRTAKTGYLLERTQLTEAEATFKLTDAIFDRMTRANPLDPGNILGKIAVNSNHLLHSALLGFAGSISMKTDLVTAAAVKQLYGMGATIPVSTYLDTVIGRPDFYKRMARQFGYIYKEVIPSHYASARHSILHEYAAPWVNRVSETTLRGVGLSGHNNRIKLVGQMETMGFLAGERGKTLDQMGPDFANFMRRSEITDADWNTFRAQPLHMPDGPDGAEFLVPALLLDTKLKNRQELFEKFQDMIYKFNASKTPEASLETAARLQMTSRPDWLGGMLLTSHATYLSFPMSYLLMQQRVTLSSQRSIAGKAAWVAGLATAMFTAGALELQFRELLHGRDPRPMGTTKFFTDALLISGALSVYGDYIFGEALSGRSLPETLAGPTVGFYGDVGRVGWSGVADLVGKDTKGRSTFFQEATKFLSRYTPGVSAPLIGEVMKRQLFDRMAEAADPRAYKKRRARAKQRYELNGNKSFWGEGDRMPTRAPNFGQAFTTGP